MVSGDTRRAGRCGGQSTGSTRSKGPTAITRTHTKLDSIPPQTQFTPHHHLHSFARLPQCPVGHSSPHVDTPHLETKQRSSRSTRHHHPSEPYAGPHARPISSYASRRWTLRNPPTAPPNAVDQPVAHAPRSPDNWNRITATVGIDPQLSTFRTLLPSLPHRRAIAGAHPLLTADGCRTTCYERSDFRCRHS